MADSAFDEDTKPLFQTSIEKWKEYREAKALADAGFVKVGTMYPLIFATSKTQLTAEKIERLKQDFVYNFTKS